MLIKDIITDTPKVLLLFRCYFFRFKLFQFIIRRGKASKRLEFLTVFFAWSMAIFAASNLVIEALTGKNILEISGQLDPILVIHNGEKMHAISQRTPVVLQILGDEFEWRFDIGFNQRSVFVTPLGDPLADQPCMVVDQSPDLVWPESEVQVKFDEYRELFTEDCLADPRGYFILVQRKGVVISESNVVEFGDRLTLPPVLPQAPESIFAVPDRTCFSNGAYSACFDFLDASQLSAPAGFGVMLIFALTYSVCLAAVDRVWFGVGFLDSTLSFLALNMTFIVFGGVIVLIAVAIDRFYGTSAIVPGIISIALLLTFHLFRAAMLFGHRTSQLWWKRALALGLGILVSWTLGVVLFFPLQVGLILFHDVVSGLL